MTPQPLLKSCTFSSMEDVTDPLIRAAFLKYGDQSGQPVCEQTLKVINHVIRHKIEDDKALAAFLGL